MTGPTSFPRLAARAATKRFRLPSTLLGDLSQMCWRPKATALLLTTSLSSFALWPHLAAAADQDVAAADQTDATSSTSAPAEVVVRSTHGFDTATGVTGTAPGGGLISIEDAAQAQSTVSTDYIQKQSSMSFAFQLLANAPGVTTSLADPYGMSEQFTMSVRGLNQDEIGQVVEGMPVNDIGYYTGYPSQFSDSENDDSITLSQGSVDLDAPVINAAGGLLTVYFRNPSDTPGGFLDFSYGSHQAIREFGRIETGLIGDTGIKGFISASHFTDNNWRGPGQDGRDHVDFKFVKEWGSGNKVSIVGTYNSALSSYYPEPTLADWSQSHRSFNLDANSAGPDANYWKLYQGPFRLYYQSMPSSFNLGDGLTLGVTPYFQYGYGNGPFGDEIPVTNLFFGTQPVAGPLPVPPSSIQDGYAVVEGNFTDAQYRYGAVIKLDYEFENHHFTAGYWPDYGDEVDTESFTTVDASGKPADVWGESGLIKLPNGQTLTEGKFHTITKVNAFFVGDSIDLMDDKLKIDFGLKQVFATRDGTNEVPGPQYGVSIMSKETLPRAAARFQLDSENQIFAKVSTNFRTPVESVLYNTYSIYDGSLQTQGSTNVKDEYSISEEIGWRYQSDVVVGSATFFNYNFSNRQVQSQVAINGVLVTSSINAGGQTSRGVDAEVGLVPYHHFSPYVSFEYLDATLDDNFQTSGTAANGATVTDYLQTAGKTAVRSPNVVAAASITYDDGTYFGTLTGKYTGSQYSTFLNDEKIPGYATADITLGYRFPSIGFFSAA